MNSKKSDKIEKMGLSELQITYERQKKMLTNKTFIGKLPDKGQKIQDFCSSLEKRIEELKELHKQQNYTEGLTEMFSSLAVGCSRNKVDTNHMEWTGKVPNKQEHADRDVSNCDDSDEEKDVVKILATTNQMSKIVIEERSGTPDSGHESPSQKLTPSKFSRILEHGNTVSDDKSFKPFRSLKNEKVCKGTYFKENTSATPPIYKYHSVPLSLEESLEIQKQTAEKMKSIEVNPFALPPKKRTEIWAALDSSEVHPDEENEVFDDEDVNDQLCIVVPCSE